ncbi:hypothetical protein BKA83DRAFT_4371719 [Pisolithus microcarpus]|nr:hypothetical protein BKA83DRAFT_4371719 [Pisolithus microcarpus]
MIESCEVTGWSLIIVSSISISSPVGSLVCSGNTVGGFPWHWFPSQPSPAAPFSSFCLACNTYGYTCFMPCAQSLVASKTT